MQTIPMVMLRKNWERFLYNTFYNKCALKNIES
jgi:hypothetical protein